MVRRLGVAQSLIHNPKILIVDEPTVGLDPEERIHFRQLMAKLGKERIIILSTHIVGDLGSGCHDLALIDRGRLEFRGALKKLIEKAKGFVFEMHLEGQGVKSLNSMRSYPRNRDWGEPSSGQYPGWARSLMAQSRLITPHLRRHISPLWPQTA
jgi:ABC-2 type transport system ATP-binding protein